MKKLTSIILTVIVVFSLFIVGCATTSTVTPQPVVTTNDTTRDTIKAQTYTYDGDIDPVVFFSWNVVRNAVCTNGHMHYFLENPDQTADIKRVETMNVPSGSGKYKLVAYRYFDRGVEHVFYLDEKNAHYKQVLPKKGVGI